MKIQRLVAVATVLALGGCVSSSTQRGALIGAGTGALLGAGTGVLISDDDLLGTRADAARGDVALDAGSSIVASALVGLVFGGIVGAMVGKANDEPEVPPEGEEAQASVARPTAF